MLDAYCLFKKKESWACNTQPQTGTESELPQEEPFWCVTLRFSFAPSDPLYENVLGAPLIWTTFFILVRSTNTKTFA